MKRILINILFWLLGNSNTQTFSIQYLFGVTNMNHETRKKRWEQALARMWKDKDLLDYLYYQQESDKESVFRGKTTELSKGARIRTLFLIYSARRAYEKLINGKVESADDKEIQDEEVKKVIQSYKKLVDV